MKVHFIGISGIGASALAQYYLAKGHIVSGSDLVLAEITDILKNKGAKIYIGKHKAENLPADVNMIVYSPAVPKDNPELKQARKLQEQNNKLRIMSYPQALGELTKKYFTIAVCGTHGKSTTSAMISLALIKAGLDPTVIIGTKLKEFNNSNFRIGKSKYLIIEADEWQASFLNYWPKIIVLTNIEKEHLDYYKDLNHIIKTYKEFISHLPENGLLIANQDDKIAYRITKYKSKNKKYKIIYYSIKQKQAKKIREILKVPGEHNVYNALAVFNTVRYGIRYEKALDKAIFQALSQYKGSWRRFEQKEIKIKNKKLKIINDYAHHPTEIKATLQAARQKWPKKEIWAVFQPHQYQRSFYLFNDFVKVFKKAPVNKVIITDIYDVAGRETKGIKAKISSKKLVRAINELNVIYQKNQEILGYLSANLSGREVVIVMGAGDIYELVSKL